MDAVRGRKIVLGVSGGIAAYKALELTSRLVKAGASVRVVMTRGACRFVAPLSFAALSGHRVYTDVFDEPAEGEMPHIDLGRDADLMVIAPATADCLARIAAGLGDDMLSTVVLAMRAPLLVAPAMNTTMWQAPATRHNLDLLLGRGVHTVGPEGGLLACGDTGPGRMSEPEAIADACARLLASKRDLEGLRVLVTAGPTREAIDPVRFLSNRSSGKMGYALAQAAAERGARVTLVTGPVALEPPAGVTVHRIVSTGELLAVLEPLAKEQDMLIQAAAPADFRPQTVSPVKIPKAQVSALTLAPTPDVAALLGKAKKPGQIFAGFAAETGEGSDSARRKLREKNLDLIALNDVTAPGAGFEVDTNRLTLISPEESIPLPLMSKRQAADALLDRLLALRGGSG